MAGRTKRCILCAEDDKDSHVCRNSDQYCGFHAHYLFMKRLMGQEPTLVQPVRSQPNQQPETPEQLNLFPSEEQPATYKLSIT